MTEADRLIRALKLKRHPEGGWYRETLRDATGSKGRAHSTAILFLLREGEFSRWHRIDAVEVWHWYAGAALELHIARTRGRAKRHLLGHDFKNGQHPQIVVPARHWQAARPLGDYALVGCTVAPGFVFEKFELAPISWEAARPRRGRSRATKRGPDSPARD
ncbi:MAG TPA: cupin domain-containing protein [Rhizomicrobium sp.]|nr:cupin domain-containing protein [Rhizomicrobium sp.]